MELAESIRFVRGRLAIPHLIQLSLDSPQFIPEQR